MRWAGREGRRTLVVALCIHLGVRVLSLLAIVVAALLHDAHGAGLGATLGASLGKSDGVWYLGIAHHGYGPPPPIGPDGVYVRLTSLAFFPLFPLLVRAVALTGMPYLGAGLTVTLVAGAVAAVLIAEWSRRFVGERGAVLLVAVWALLPSSVVLDLVYSEALFVAAAAGCLLALQRRRWLTAALAATLVGLTRPTGGGLVLAVVVAAVVELRRPRLDPGDGSRWRPVVAVLLAPVGLVVSLVHVAVVTGRVDGWFWLERTVWKSGFDGGWSALQHVGQLVTGGRTAHRLPEVVAVLAIAAAIAAAVAVVRGRRPGDGPPSAYALAAAVLAVGERGYFYVKPRLLFVCFPLLVPLARRLAAVSMRRLALLAVPVTVVSVSYNAYLVVNWPKAL